MIAYIQGELNFLGPTYVVIEAGGLGYHIHISLHTYSELVNARKEPGAHVRLFTYLHIKEDAHTLYGFASEEERRLFSHLISVRSEEHTSELQSRENLVCRLLLE